MRNVFLILIIVLAGVMTCISITLPSLIPSNQFLEHFIGPDMLNIMAVIMTIAIASIATIHIWFNELESKCGKKVFGKARREINHDAEVLIWLFVIELIVLIVRSFFEGKVMVISLFDGMALLLLLSSVLCLVDIMGTVKALTPED